MAEQDFKRAMMNDPVLMQEAGMAMPDPAEAEDAVTCPTCGASVKKIEAAAGGARPETGEALE